MSYWAVAQTESQREHVAANFLKQNCYEIYLPRIIAKAGARERVVPLFPTYLFVRIEDRWWSIQRTIGVLRVLMADDRPAMIDDKTVCAIQKREGDNGLVKLPKPPSPASIVRGQNVVIREGSFSGRVGVYDGMAAHDRVRVLLTLMGRSVPVSLRMKDIQAVEAPTACT
jgi:transcription antitermination factor NusG